MGRLRIFARVTCEGRIECYEDDVRVVSVLIEDISNGFVRINEYSIHTIESNKRFRLERDFWVLGKHSVILTTENYCDIPFTLHLLDKMFVIWMTFGLSVFAMFLQFKDEDKPILYAVVALTTLIMVYAYLLRRQKKAIVSFFTIPPDFLF